MSGFLAVLGPRPAEVDADALAAALRHRAGRGTVSWQDDAVLLVEAVDDARRSSSTAALDAGLPAERGVVAADAHLGDRGTLRTRLGAAAGSSDRQLLRAAFVQWGAELGERVLGEFAFCAWEPAVQRLTAFTDHLGSRELYWARTPSGVVLGTELLAVARLSGRDRDVHEGSVAQFLLLGSVRRKGDTATAFEGVHRLLPAHRLVATGDGVTVSRYWELPHDVPMRRFADPRDCVAEFRHILKECVQGRLEDVDRSVVHLSGGMDSTAVAALAVELVREGRLTTELEALCVGYSVMSPDTEPYYAGLAARRLGLPFSFLNGDAFGLTRPPTLRAEPLTDFSTGFTAEIGAQSRARGSLVLTGKGGDELLPPTPLYRVLLKHRPPDAARLYRWLWRFGGARPPLGGYRQYAKALLGREGQAAPPSEHPLGDWPDPDFAVRVGLQERWDELFHDAPDQLHLTQPDVLAYFARAKWATRDELAPAVDFPDMTMPFADLRMVRFALEVPPALWYRRKQLLRDAMAADLPVEVLQRRKTPAPSYPVHVLGRDDARWVDAWEPTPALAQYVRRDRVPEVHGTSSLRTAAVDTRPLFLDAWLGGVVGA